MMVEHFLNGSESSYKDGKILVVGDFRQALTPSFRSPRSSLHNEPVIQEMNSKIPLLSHGVSVWV
jgi:hypothetical protein